MDQPQSLRFEDNKGLIHMQAKAGHKLAMLNGANLTYDDCYQEASLAFVLAVRGYKPESGFKFSTYYTKACYSQFHKTIGQMTGVKNLNAGQRDQIRERQQENKRRAAAAEEQLDAMRYGLHPMMFSEVGQIEDGAPFEESLASDAPTPEEVLIAKQAVKRATHWLSPEAKLVIEWLRDPPPELLREVNAQTAYAERCAERGDKTAMPGKRGLCVDAIGAFMQLAGIDLRDRLPQLRAELREFVEEVEARA